MQRIMWLLVLLLSLGLVGVVSAQEPDEDPRENACYNGGDLEGKCSIWDTEQETEWAWNCGYYYAEYVGGEISLDEAPETCKILFETIKPFALCLYLGGINREIADGLYMLIQGAPNQPSNARLYIYGALRSTSPCDELESSNDSVIWMQTPAYIDYQPALDRCAAADPSVNWNLAFPLNDPGLANFNWYCMVAS